MLVEITPVTGIDLVPGSFMPRWKFGSHHKEKFNAKRAAHWANKKQARLHVLAVDDRDYGFYVVDIHQFENEKQFYIQLLYLFVSKQYRKGKGNIEGITASAYMLSKAIEQSLEVSRFIPIKALILEPASPKLIPLYSSLGFTQIPHLPEFMTLPLNSV